MKRRLKLSEIMFYVFLFFSFFLLRDSLAGDAEQLQRKVMDTEDEVETIHQDIEERREIIEALENKELSLIDEIYKLDRELERKREDLKRIRNEKKQVETNLQSVGREISDLEANQTKLEIALKGRLKALYKTRQGGILKILFSTEDINDLERNLYYIKSVVQYDMHLIKEFRENQMRLEGGRKRLEVQKKELNNLSEEYERKRDTLSRQKETRRSMIKKVRQEEALQLASLEELEDAAFDLQNLVDKLRKQIDEEEKKNVRTDFDSMKGRLEMPVNGKIISFYGKVQHPTFKTVTFNKGVEIVAPAGSEVNAVFEGEVVYSGWFKGYGKIIIIDHGNGYHTLLAHLSDTFKNVGDEVDRGDVVALVGDTGSLKGPMLYFEVRYHGEPKDPLNWIVKK
jgi:septal ring factor EnvC (AmiA/AmiB activator)